MTSNRNAIQQEMVLDLCFRLRLADDLCCRVADSVIAAVASDDFSLKQEATGMLHDFSSSLRIIYADLLRLTDDKQIVFRPEFADWEWELPDADAKVSRYLEHLQWLMDGMRLVANTEFLRSKVCE